MTSSTDSRRCASSAPRGTSNGTRAAASVRFARTMRCAIVALGTRKARAISSVVRPPRRRSVSAVIVERGGQIALGALLPSRDLVTELLVLALEQLAPTQGVDGPMLRGRHE